MSERLVPISHHIGAELITEIGPQLPARAEELSANPMAIQELLVRRINAKYGGELGSDMIDPGHLGFLELGLIGGRIIGEFARGVLTGEGPDARFKPDYLEFEEDKYTEGFGDEYTLLERIVRLGQDVDASVDALAGMFLHTAAKSWLRPYIGRYDDLAPTASLSDVPTIRRALSVSSLGDTTTDVMRLAITLPYMTKNGAGELTAFDPAPEQREDAALNLLYLETTRASMHAETFIKAKRLHHLEHAGYILKREPREGQDRTLDYVFQPHDQAILQSVMPRTSDVAPEAKDHLLVKCFAHQPYNPGRLQKDGRRTGGSRFTGLQLLSRAVIRTAADKGLFAE